MRLAMAIIGLLIGAIVLITLAAVYTRYVMNDPLSWTEQVSRILFVWVTFLGAAVLYRQRMHITIDMFLLMLPARIRTAVYWFVEVTVAAFICILLFYGARLSLTTLDQTFGALDITPATFYAAAPVSSLLMLLFFVEKLFDPSKRGPAEGGSSHIL
jgi:TRAP-type C4-dicarboxylate transport system permease small subunit